MEATTQKIDLNKIDKTDWETFRFEEIASKISETVDPNSTDLEIYVGLEHLDTEDIHIRRKGTPDDVSGGKLKCYPGDVIFGKRRAYQRKAAIVDFEGICSAHAFVFRANPEVIDPKLFPFFLHSDQFMHRMVDISVGGLSPTINWGDLKHQEFLLPPKTEQARLAELLWAMDEVIEKEKKVFEKFMQYKNSLVDSLLTGKIRLPGFTSTLNKFSLLEIANFRRGSFPQPYGLPEWYDDVNGFPFVQVYDIDFNLKLKSNTKVKISKKATVFSVFVPKGTLIISIQGSIGRVAITQYDAYVDRTILIFTEYIKKTNILFFSYVLQKLFYEKEKSARGAVIKTITKEELSKFIIPFPEIIEQEKIASEFNKLEVRNSILNNKISASQSLQKSLINQIF